MLCRDYISKGWILTASPRLSGFANRGERSHVFLFGWWSASEYSQNWIDQQIRLYRNAKHHPTTWYYNCTPRILWNCHFVYWGGRVLHSFQVVPDDLSIRKEGVIANECMEATGAVISLYYGALMTGERRKPLPFLTVEKYAEFSTWTQNYRQQPRNAVVK